MPRALVVLSILLLCLGTAYADLFLVPETHVVKPGSRINVTLFLPNETGEERTVDLPLRIIFDGMKARTGLSPYQFVLEKRVGKAQELLTHSDLSIAEIAIELGCAEPTARVHLHRGRQRLAVMLGEEPRFVSVPVPPVCVSGWL